MKINTLIINLILTLLFSSVTFASSNIGLSYSNVYLSNVFSDVSEDCANEYLNYYYDCFQKLVAVGNDPIACEVFEDKVCKHVKENIYNNESLNMCKGNRDSILKDTMDYLKIFYVFECSIDENGKRCPLSQNHIENKNLTDAEVGKGSCYSTQCLNDLKIVIEYKYIRTTLDKVSGKEDPLVVDTSELEEAMKTCKLYSTSNGYSLNKKKSYFFILLVCLILLNYSL